MATISIPWGAESLELALPVDWTIQHVGRTNISPAPADWPERLAGRSRARRACPR